MAPPSLMVVQYELQKLLKTILNDDDNYNGALSIGLNLSVENATKLWPN